MLVLHFSPHCSLDHLHRKQTAQSSDPHGASWHLEVLQLSLSPAVGAESIRGEENWDAEMGQTWAVATQLPSHSASVQPSGCLIHGATGSYWKNLLITLINSQKKLSADKSLEMRRIAASRQGQQVLWLLQRAGSPTGHLWGISGGCSPSQCFCSSIATPQGKSERIPWVTPQACALWGPVSAPRPFAMWEPGDSGGSRWW